MPYKAILPTLNKAILPTPNKTILPIPIVSARI